MKKLVQGIIEFRKNFLKDYRKKFSSLVDGQAPDTLLIACCDSRVVPDLFSQSDPGDSLVLRNIGNLVPSYQKSQHNSASVAAALEFSVNNLNVGHIVVCGHSECAAMRFFFEPHDDPKDNFIKNWLQHALPSYERLEGNFEDRGGLAIHNYLSRISVLQQLEHLKTYPFIKERMDQGRLQIHGWWFDIGKADVYHYDPQKEDFQLLDSAEAKKILKTL